MFFDGNEFAFGIPRIDDSNKKYFNYMMQKDNKLVSSKEGFLRGNMFADEYVPYKNLTYFKINAESEQENLLNSIMEKEFAVNDLNLYLDLHPEDMDMYEEFKKYVSECIELKDMYAKKYGPLTLDQVQSQKYKWQENPWPWDNMGGGMYV